MKIRDTDRRLPLDRTILTENLPAHALKGTRQKQTSTFEEELRESHKHQVVAKLKTFLAEIESEGQKLAKSRTLDILRKYKELIRAFIREVVQNMYLLKEERARDFRGKQQSLILIKNINKSLEDVVKMVFSKETTNLKLLEKVGEIKGMLIDLYS